MFPTQKYVAYYESTNTLLVDELKFYKDKINLLK